MRLFAFGSPDSPIYRSGGSPWLRSRSPSTRPSDVYGVRSIQTEPHLGWTFPYISLLSCSPAGGPDPFGESLPFVSKPVYLRRALWKRSLTEMPVRVIVEAPPCSYATRKSALPASSFTFGAISTLVISISPGKALAVEAR